MDNKYLIGKKEARLNIYLTNDLFEKVDDYCKQIGVSKSAMVSMALGTYFSSLECSKNIVHEVLRNAAKKEIDALDLHNAVCDVVREEFSGVSEK